MSKQSSAPPTMDKAKNGHKRRPLPEQLTPAVAQAVLEDAVLEAAADLAALSATLELSGAVPVALVPETPEEVEILQLASVPGLGPARRAGLAALGITTLAGLSAAPPETLAQVRGLTGENVRKIKGWLAENAGDTSAPAPSEVGDGGPHTPPMFIGEPPADVASLDPVPESADPTVASSNQHVQDALAQLDAAVAQIRAALPGGKLDKKLARQLDAVSTVASELPESFDTLSVKSIAQGAKTLDKITALILEAAGMGRLSEKKQLALRDELKERRKRLEKTIGG